MKHTEKRWKSFDGLTMYSQSWITESNPKAVIYLVHGLGEHSSRYSGWAEQFTEKGYNVSSFDLRGHGRSEGKRGYSSDYEHFLTDIEDFIQAGREDFPGIPIFLYGHSLGGNLVVNYSCRKILDVNGLVITSPWLELVTKPSPFIFFLLEKLSSFIPGMLVSNGLKIEDISRDSKVVHDYKTDPLVHDRVALRTGFQIIQEGKKAASSIHKINVPMLVLHGSADRITSCKTTRNFVRHSGDKTTYIEFEGGFHELHNDLDRANVFKSIVDWFENNL